jgi:hypothetical protein
LIDGKEINNGASFRYGIRNTLVGADIILWLEIKREEPFNITLN